MSFLSAATTATTNFGKIIIRRPRNTQQIAAAARSRRGFSTEPGSGPKGRGPVSWVGLGLAGVAAASAVSYFSIMRERRLEEAMGKIVSSESGWSPDPDIWAKRQYKEFKGSWFPVDDPAGALGKPAIGGPWSLVNLDGKLVTEKTFAGQWTLLYFGFARCPDICPSEMVKIARAIDQLKKTHPELAARIRPVFVSVDPARDSLVALKDYAKDFHPDYVFLTGSPEQVQKMAKSYRVYVSKADETDDGDYLVDHSIVTYFHDEKGDLADVFTQSMKPSDIVEKVVHHMTFVPSF